MDLGNSWTRQQNNRRIFAKARNDISQETRGLADRLRCSAINLALTLAVVVGLTSCGGVSRSARVEAVSAFTPVVLNSGDVVRLTFTTAPEMNQTQKIRSDGKVSLPQVGQILAAGKTLSQFENEVKSRYRTQLTNTDVVVTLDSAAIEVYVSGSVKSPGKMAFDRPTTVLQAIMQAGGPNPFGNLRSVHLIRISNGVERTQLLDLRPTLAGETTHAFYVKNGDIIQVPQSPF
ncbi:MAG: polysaccharide export protein [Verrucomicrobiota bacterium]|nr:polysaccharide export protein [Verrucomicrobiota bacterium]